MVHKRPFDKKAPHVYMLGSGDKVAIVLLALATAFWMPATYSRERPLLQQAFTVPLRRKAVERASVAALDDPKRVVRFAAARCREAWLLLGKQT